MQDTVSAFKGLTISSGRYKKQHADRREPPTVSAGEELPHERTYDRNYGHLKAGELTPHRGDQKQFVGKMAGGSTAKGGRS